MRKLKIVLVFLIVAVIAVFFVFHLDQYLNLAYFKAQQAHIQSVVNGHPFASAAVFFAVYVTLATLSLPGAAIMTLVAGALFGLLWGTLLASFASSIGATLAFLAARFVLRDWVQNKFARHLKAINRGIDKDGAFYLLSLRLVPLFPFFVINLIMALTPIRTATFYLASQLGMLAGTLVYVYAGTRIAAIGQLSDVLSPGLISALVLLGLFPLAARKAVAYAQSRKALRGYPKPRHFDRNLIVIGAGSAGLVTAYIAATVRARVTLIEKHRMGGDCLNYGCVPSKAMIRSARIVALMRRGGEFGVHADNVHVDFAQVMARIQRVIAEIAPHDAVERYQSPGVDTIEGEARITSPYTVAVEGRELTTRSIVIATGARPLVPPIAGLDAIDYLTSDTVWNLRELPERLLVLGGGSIGCELSQAFARFGSQVTQVEMAPRLLAREDPDVSAHLAERFAAERITVRTGHKATAVDNRGGENVLVCEHDGQHVTLAFDRILVTVGRTPNTQGFGLEELDIKIASDRSLEVNEFLQTRYPNIFACGDVAGPFQFTHTAAHQAWYASVHALFLGLRRFKADYSVIPWVTFTGPEVAHVGRNESQAREDGIEFEVTRYDLGELDRAITDGRSARVRQGADRTGQGQDTRGDHRRRGRRRADRRIRHRHAPRPGSEQDSGHHSCLPHADRGQQIRRRRVETRACARAYPGVAGTLSCLAARPAPQRRYTARRRPMSGHPTLSIIVPVVNEAPGIAHALQSLAGLGRRGAEIIVVDGASDDDTLARARPHTDRTLTAVRGRAAQMNAGAQVASGGVLLFLHADTHLPRKADGHIHRALADSGAHCWGRFDVRIDGTAAFLPMIAWLMNRRSRLTGIATGDQAIFVTRHAFDRAGGFPHQALMEDIALARRLKRLSRPACLRPAVTTSGRRWQQNGVLRIIVLMWWLRLAYACSVSPNRLARWYGRTG